MYQKFIDKKFNDDSMRLIDRINEIIWEYQNIGYKMTLRQLYYQLVASDEIPNTENSYKKIGSILNDGRLCGLIDWDVIEDRTRSVKGLGYDVDVPSALQYAVDTYRINPWDHYDGSVYCEVWIEKDALVSIVERVCRHAHINYLSCRGYPSQTLIYDSAKRLETQYMNGNDITILHLGDHDPSGIDMTRDLQDRLNMMMSNGYVHVERIALTYDQIQEFNPPPNPTKLTDTRSKAYIAEFGYDCWELDALKPDDIESIIRFNLEAEVDLEELEKISADIENRNHMQEFVNTYKPRS